MTATATHKTVRRGGAARFGNDAGSAVGAPHR